MYEARERLLNRRTFIFVGLFFVVITLFVTLLNLRFVKIVVNTPAEISIHKLDEEPVFSETKVKELSTVRWGSTFSATARDDFEEARLENVGGFFLNPFVTVELLIKPQVASQKITSNGDSCVLYDSPVDNIVISSDCTNNTSSNIRLITNGAQEKGILPGVTVIQAAPSRQGFYFVTSSLADSSKFDVTLFTAKTGSTKQLLSALSDQPRLVVNQSTGYTGGIIHGNKFVTEQTMLQSKTNSVDLKVDEPKEGESTDVSYVINKSGLFIFTLTKNSQIVEGHDQKVVHQTIRLINPTSGEPLYTKRISPKQPVSIIKSSADTLFIGLEGPQKTFKSFDQSGEIKLKTKQLDIQKGVVTSDENIYLVEDGGVWAYSKNNGGRQANLIYKADELDVVNLYTVGNKTLVSATSTKAGEASQVSNFEIDLTKESPNKKRIESILPILNWTENLLYADVYRKNIVVNFQNNNPSLTESPQETFSKLGITNIKDYTLRINDASYFQRPNTNPTNTSEQEFGNTDDYTGDGAPPEEHAH